MIPRIGKTELIGAASGIGLFLLYQLSQWATAGYPIQPGVAGTAGVVLGSVIIGMLGAGCVWGVRVVILFLPTIGAKIRAFVRKSTEWASIMALVVGLVVGVYWPDSPDKEREAAWVHACIMRRGGYSEEEAVRVCEYIGEKARTSSGREELCGLFAESQRRAEERAQQAGVMDWNLYKDDYIRNGMDRDTAMTYARDAYIAGAMTVVNFNKGYSGCP